MLRCLKDMSISEDSKCAKCCLHCDKMCSGEDFACRGSGVCNEIDIAGKMYMRDNQSDIKKYTF